jgi:hypothetical protein
MDSGRRWTVLDRSGREVYLTDERWQHITDPHNHLEMAEYEEQLKETIRSGKRKQDSLNPLKYRYMKAFENLAGYNTHIVAIVLFRFIEDQAGNVLSNNYIVTAYQKTIR